MQVTVASGISCGVALLFALLYLLERRAHRRSAREATAAREAARLERTRRHADSAPSSGAIAPDARAFRDVAEAEVQRAARYGRQIALILIEAGQDAHARAKAWPRFTTLYQTHLRTSDQEGRLDDGACAALLPEADVEIAHRVAERLRAEWDATSDREAPAIRVGVASLIPADDSFDTLVARVRMAMQEAGGAEAGRVVLAGPSG